jgi:N-acetylglucosamine-6-sulfatase
LARPLALKTNPRKGEQMKRLALLSGVLLVVAALFVFAEEPKAQTTPPEQPNIIHIMFDDSNANMLNTMDNAKSYIRNRGVSFPNAYFATSLCCPSRATQQTGLYPHNTGVLDNSPPNGGYSVFKANGHEAHTYGVWANNAGYQTAFFGKHMNGYDGSVGTRKPNPPGWDTWEASVGSPQDKKGIQNGVVVSFAPKQHDQWVADRGIGWISAHAADPGPFLSVLSFYAPHNPAIHPASYDSKFTSAPLPKTLAYNENTVDKPTFMKNYGPVTASQETALTEHYRDRLRSVEYVDDRLAVLFSGLQSAGQLDNTYIIMWADNANHLGEHRAPSHQNGGKGLPHLVDSRMPLWVAGPGIAPLSTNDKLISAVDVAPTIAEMAGGAPTRQVDGRSFLGLAKGVAPSSWRNYAYAEFPQGAVSDANIPIWHALYWATGTYHQWPANNQKELYDLTSDPYQINNLLYGGISAVEQQQVTKYNGIVNQMKTCDGAQCRTIEEQP